MNMEPIFQRRVHPGIARATQYCLDLAGRRALPRRSDFRPTAVRSILGYIFLIDVVPGPDSYFFKLFGVHMSVLYGSDLTGKSLGQIDNEELRACLRSTYDAVVAEKTFQYICGQYVWHDCSVGIERLLVPMTDEDGQINSIFGLAIPDVATDSLRLFAGIGAAQLKIDDVLGAAPVLG